MTTQPHSTTLRATALPRIGRVACWSASLALVVLAVGHLPGRNLVNVFTHAHPAFVGLALLSVAINTLAKALRWRRLLAPAGECQPVGRTLRAVIVGQMLNWISPVRIGDLGRVYLLGHDAPAPLLVLASVAVEKLLDVVAYALVALVVLVAVPLPSLLAQPLHSALLVGTAAIVCSILALRYRRLISAVLVRILRLLPGRWWEHRVASLLDSARRATALSTRNDRKALIGWSVLIWLTAILNNLLILLAVDLFVPWPAALLLLVGLQAGIALPSLPGTVGVFEYVCVVILAVWGIPQAPALSYAVLLHSVVMLPPVVVGAIIWALTLRSRNPESRGNAPLPDTGRTASMTPLSTCTAPRPQTGSTTEVLGIRIAALDGAMLLDQASSWCDAGISRSIGYVNAHCLNRATYDSCYRATLGRTDLVYADGVGVVLAARLLHGATLHKATGADWIDDFCARGARQGWRIYLLAGRPGVAATAAHVLAERYPALLIVGTQDGFFEPEREAMVVAIADAAPHMLFVGMSTPRQEEWIDRHRSALPHTVCFAVGALFDYVAGLEPRAPVPIRAAGLEWAWRLLVDPGGKWRRYLIGNPLFVYRVLHQKWRMVVTGIS